MSGAKTVLVVGATGDLGGRVVDTLLARGTRVRALVREGTDPSRLVAKGVEIAHGDMLDPASLERAMSGADAVVTSAAGYTRRRKGDSLKKVDDLGNRNLVDAAKKTGISRFVFTSILTCDQARDVPHFWQKKLIEDYLGASGVPFVALRPGAFLGGGSARFFFRALRKGRMMAFGSATVRWTYIHPDDVARCLVLAVDDPRAVGRRIDLGTDRPVSTIELADILARLLGREVKVSTGSARILKIVGTIGGLFLPFMRDMMAMGRYFETGKYVADTRVQTDLFGPVPTIEETARRMLTELDLASRTN
ncbi:MAG: SDR family oxidoreductase [Methanobacteriota archaeon]